MDASAPDWTLDRVILAPAAALAAIQELEQLRMQSNRHITNLIEANNRYLERARAAEAARGPLDPLTAPVLADALSCFWNAAIGEARNRDSSVALDAASVMAEGFAAVADRLKGGS